MSESIKTMAHMVNHRVADIETTRKIEEQKAQRLAAIKAHCKTLRGDSLLLMQQTYPELFDDSEE